MKYCIRLFFALVVATLVLPTQALAQSSDWQERRTERFVILYAAGDADSAEEYAGFVDSIYDEVAAIFGHQTRTPVSLRLYPSLNRYYELNPLARGLSGIVAHADSRRHEVAVILPQTRSQTPDEIQNNVRHELSHIVVSELSNDRLNVGLQEGIAQYVEHPSGELQTKIALLRRANEEDRLLPWSALDERDRVYQSPQVSYPQSLSVVAFLVERYSFAKLRELLPIAARSSGYRSALERTFGVAADQLEREWREWLPSYLAGGYRRNALSAYDLSVAQSLLRQGRYAEAQQELETAIEWLRGTGETETLRKAEDLLDQSVEGQRAVALASDARAALAQGDYERAAGLVAEAQRASAAIGDTRQEQVLKVYAKRAERGRRAHALLREARALAEGLRYPQAREAADRAAVEFVALGNRAQADAARELRVFLDRRQSTLGSLLVLLGIGGISVSIFRRVRGAEAEAW